MGRLHLMTTRKTEGAEAVAAADTAQSGRRFAEQHNVPKVYSDYRQMLEKEKELDAVVIHSCFRCKKRCESEKRNTLIMSSSFGFQLRGFPGKHQAVA